MAAARRQRGKRHKGEGSLFQRSRDGRWVARVDLGWRDGKRDRREFTGATLEEAQGKRDAFLALRREGFTPKPGRPVTVAEWMAHWLHNVAKPRVEATTWERSYRQRTEELIVPFIGMIRLTELTEEDIESWHASLRRRTSERTGRRLSPSTIVTAHRILSSALKEAVRRGRMPRNPCSFVPAPRIQRGEAKVPGSAEAARILAACTEWPNGARWVLAIATGLRQGEALGLRWLDVKLEDPASVAVRQTLTRLPGAERGYGKAEWVFKAPKSEKSYRTVALPAVAVVALREHRKAQREQQLAAKAWHDYGLVFCRPSGEPVHAKADLDDWRALLATLGLPPYRVHDLRHATATALLEMGTDVRVVQEILGHSSAVVTQGTYQHVGESLHRAAADSLDEWLGGGA